MSSEAKGDHLELLGEKWCVSPLNWKVQSMKTLVALLSASVLLAGCDKPDHPEAFIKPHAGSYAEIGMFPDAPLTSGYLIAEGIWTIEGDDRIATPINVSRIECYRSNETCTDYRANLNNVSGTVFLSQSSDTYIIRSWDSRQIVAVAEGECRNIELKIDYVVKTVMSVTANNPGQTTCTEITGLMTKPRVSRLISGQELDAIIRADGI